MPDRDEQSAIAVATEAGELAKEKVTFSFGANWDDFVRNYLTPDRVEFAANSLLAFLERKDFQGLYFLDIGCGSGLFSLAAHQLGAKRIVSLDVDPKAVACAERLRQHVGSPANWDVRHCSILDEAALAQVEPADLVYAWGSLHHTGDMWRAIRNAAGLVRDGGLFFLAIYNRVDGRSGSEYWLRVKRLYNRCSLPTKRLMEVLYFLRYQFLPQLIRFQNPFAYERIYKRRRGMTRWVDIRDWLGGYPYEYARTDEILLFCLRELGMSLVNLRTVNNLGLNEFLLRK